LGATANYLNYETYKDSACTIPWNSTSSGNEITLTLPNDLLAHTITGSFWVCITQAGQIKPAGTYTDTVSFRIRNLTDTPPSLSPTGTFPVTIMNPATCAAPTVATVAFGTYVAFRGTALVSPPANVVANCTLNLPYTLTLDSNSGVVVGLNYSLALSAIGTQTGSGANQTFTITGTMPAGQAGTCTTGSCPGTDASHVLTITY